jgi:KDO2-lipid IV(A) lauroyltransferase
MQHTIALGRSPAVSKRPSLTDQLEFVAFRVAFAFCAALPLRWGLRLGPGIGLLLYVLDRRDRQIALTNLALAFPDKTESERRRILRATCRQLGRMVFEVAHTSDLTPENLSSCVTIAEPELWRATLARVQKSGAIILTGHFGNWELLAYACGLLGHPVTLVHRPLRNPLVERDVSALRRRAGTEGIAKRAAAKEALRRLKAGALLAIPFDQNQIRSFGVFVDFFGVPASTTTGPVRLAKLTGAPIIPVFLVRDGESGRHRIEVLPEVQLVWTGDREADLRVNTQRCSDVFEQMVRKHPDHWIWFHKRWRTRPPGEPRFY